MYLSPGLLRWYELFRAYLSSQTFCEMYHIHNLRVIQPVFFSSLFKDFRRGTFVFRPNKFHTDDVNQARILSGTLINWLRNYTLLNMYWMIECFYLPGIETALQRNIFAFKNKRLYFAGTTMRSRTQNDDRHWEMKSRAYLYLEPYAWLPD